MTDNPYALPCVLTFRTRVETSGASDREIRCSSFNHALKLALALVPLGYMETIKVSGNGFVFDWDDIATYQPSMTSFQCYIVEAVQTMLS